MKKIYLIILSSILISACTPKNVYISDIDVERKTSSNSTRLERIVSEDKFKDAILGVAVLTGIDESGKNYVALAPNPNRGTYISDIAPSMIRALEIKEARELLKAITFAIENYDAKVNELQSINSSFQSYLQSKTVLLQGQYISPILSNFLTFTFVNVKNGAEANMYFTNLSSQANSVRSAKKLSKEKLIHLSSLLSTAITKIDIEK